MSKLTSVIYVIIRHDVKINKCYLRNNKELFVAAVILYVGTSLIITFIYVLVRMDLVEVWDNQCVGEFVFISLFKHKLQVCKSFRTGLRKFLK